MERETKNPVRLQIRDECGNRLDMAVSLCDQQHCEQANDVQATQSGRRSAAFLVDQEVVRMAFRSQHD